ncbi:hypothetical protein VNO77_03959 [Canavalia gladiata]|uniref:Uncharacterized protein n=1 Tax=Canavalia gladiata TaxID=3824 RepID=A0AAN9MVM9_CANGL
MCCALEFCLKHIDVFPLLYYGITHESFVLYLHFLSFLICNGSGVTVDRVGEVGPAGFTEVGYGENDKKDCLFIILVLLNRALTVAGLVKAVPHKAVEQT